LVRAAASGADVGAISDGRRVTPAGDALLNLFIRTTIILAGYCPGIPAVLAFIISGHRQRFPGSVMRWLLVLSQLCCALATAVVDERRIAGGDHRPAGGGSALWWLLSSRRLKACFREEQV
jgi:hypothetical protein